jgi:hypothetical protein
MRMPRVWVGVLIAIAGLSLLWLALGIWVLKNPG